MNRDLKVGAIWLNNFKAFDRKGVFVPVAPITLLFGENSAGKSSILQALRLVSSLLMGEITETNVDFRSWGLDLSDLGNLLNRKDEQRPSDREFNFGFWFADELEDPTARPPWIEENTWLSSMVDWNIQQEYFREQPWIGPKSTWLTFKVSDLEKPENYDPKYDPEKYDNIVGLYISEIRYVTVFCNSIWTYSHETQTYNSSRFKSNLGEKSEELEPITGHTLKVVPKNGKAQFTFQTTGESENSEELSLRCWLELRFHKAINAIDAWMAPMIHLGPSRKIPEEADYNPIERKGSDQSMARAESIAWKALKNNEGSIIERLNDWLGKHHLDTHFEWRCFPIISWGIVKQFVNAGWEERPLLGTNIHLDETSTVEFLDKYKNLNNNSIIRIQFIEECIEKERKQTDQKNIDSNTKYISHLEISLKSLLKFYYANKLDQYLNLLYDLKRNCSVTFANIGQGMHNMVPILVHSLIDRDTLQLIEQPELHLHPRLQAELGDLFVQGIQNGNRFLVETHSEHLMLRLLRRIRETSDHPSRQEFKLDLSDLKILHVSSRELDPEERKVLREQALFQEGLDTGVPDDLLLSLFSINKNTVRVEVIPITPNGDLEINWPGGFFPERLREIYSSEELEKWFRMSSEPGQVG